MSIRTGILLTLGLLVAPPASATIVDFTLTGTVAALHDTANAFGGAMTGDPFTLVFRVDTNRGRFGAGAGGSGDGSGVFGGTKYIGTSDASFSRGVTVSPVAAYLKIAGRTRKFAGSYFGNADTFNNYTGVGQGGAGYSGGDLRAQGLVQQGLFSGPSTIDASFFSNGVVPFPLITQPFTLAIDGTKVTANVTFSQVLTDAVTHQGIETVGSLNATSLTAAPGNGLVPEPASWALMVAGLVVAGGAFRRRGARGTVFQ